MLERSLEDAGGIARRFLSTLRLILRMLDPRGLNLALADHELLEDLGAGLGIFFRDARELHAGGLELRVELGRGRLRIREHGPEVRIITAEADADFVSHGI